MNLVGPRLKIKRAEQHIAEIEIRIAHFVETYFKSFVEYVDSKTGDLVLNYEPEQSLRFDLAPVVGDAIHNLRTALDLAWREFLGKVAPSAVDDYTKFPVRDSRKGVVAAIGRIEIRSVSGLQDFVLGMEPYYRGKGHAIWALHALDIKDKHMILLPLFDVAAFRVYVQDKRRNIDEVLAVRSIGRDIVHRFPPGSELKHKAKPAYEVLFDKGLPMQHEPIVKTLQHLVEVINGVLIRLEGFM